MNPRSLTVIFLALLAGFPALQAEEISASDVLASAVGFHDPEGTWGSGTFKLHFEETRPDGSSRKTEILIDNGRGRFEYTTRRDGALIEGELEPDGCELRLNGSTEFSDKEREEHRLSCERLAWIRNYYVYLWGLPMKLHDPGTLLDSQVRTTSFDDRAALALRVTYEESVGSDTWYFYFDPATRGLIGYRFYHDESANDGEYILLEGEVRSGGLRLPRSRSWYTHAEDKLLGTDTLVLLERIDD